jgi:hypothetical protein
MTTAHDFSFAKLDEPGEIKLADYAGKAVLIVNVASACGFTSQYRDLEALYEAKVGKGLVIIGVPCNDFGHQEPGCRQRNPRVLRHDVSRHLPDDGEGRDRVARTPPPVLPMGRGRTRRERAAALELPQDS